MYCNSMIDWIDAECHVHLQPSIMFKVGHIITREKPVRQRKPTISSQLRTTATDN